MTQHRPIADPTAPARAGVGAAHWRLELLGRFRLDDGRMTPLDRLASRAITLLLARLALEPGRSHGREELIELLWPGVDLDVGRNRLRYGLSTLRSTLERAGGAGTPVLLANRRTVSLVAEAIDCDVDAFRLALQNGDRVTAAQLYRGELLPGFFDEWVIDARRELAALAEGALLPPPLRTPGPSAAHAVAVRADGASIPRPALRLPAYLTKLLGFEDAATNLRAAVLDHRLVVLRGPGGAGKTRLAVEVARSIAGADVAHFDIVGFVPLAHCSAPAPMADAVLHALGHDAAVAAAPAVSGASPDLARERQARLELALAGRRVLLVMDNFEQLVEAGRGELANWLAYLPRLHLLVTSRRALGLDGETEQTLAALPQPQPDASLAAAAAEPAVALFVDRARAARADFHLSARNHEQVVAIVRALHGLPLAIELAAARVRSLSLVDLSAMLEHAARDAPGRALTLLARSGPRGADDARHSSMLSVVAWSWQHLAPAEQSLLASLSVFDGGATLDAATVIQQVPLVDAVALLDALVAASVVRVAESASGQLRYHPFEPVREYALMNLGAAATLRLRQAHRRWVAAWAATQGSAPELDAFREELPNLQRALTTAAAEGEIDAALRLVLDLAPALDDINLPPSALSLLRRLLQNAAGPLAAQVHAIVAQQSFEAGEREQAMHHAERALALAAPDGAERATVLRSVARVRLRTRGEADDVGTLLDEALALARRHDLHDVQARVLTLQGAAVTQLAGDMTRSLMFKREALALWRAHGPPARVTEGLVNLALSLDPKKAGAERLELLLQARTAATRLGQVRLLAFIQSVTGYVLADLRRWDDSAASYRDCLRMAWEGGIWREWFYGLWNLPRTLAHQRRPEAAARLMGCAEVFYAERFGSLAAVDRRESRRTRRLIRAQIGRDAEVALWREGSALGPVEAMALALALQEAATPAVVQYTSKRVGATACNPSEQAIGRPLR